MNLAPLLFYYQEIKAKLAQIEEGRWREDSELANMSIQEIEEKTELMRKIIACCKDMGFDTLLKHNSAYKN